MDVYLVEIEKFFGIEDRTPAEKRECSLRADMLRLFRDILEEKDISEETAARLLDKDFLKDVSSVSYTDEILLSEVNHMWDIEGVRQGAYLQGKEEAKAEAAKKLAEMAKGFRDNGIPLDVISKCTGLSIEEIKAL